LLIDFKVLGGREKIGRENDKRSMYQEKYAIKTLVK